MEEFKNYNVVERSLESRPTFTRLPIVNVLELKARTNACFIFETDSASLSPRVHSFWDVTKLLDYSIEMSGRNQNIDRVVLGRAPFLGDDTKSHTVMLEFVYLCSHE